MSSNRAKLRPLDSWVTCPSCISWRMVYQASLDAYLCPRCGAGMTLAFFERYVLGEHLLVNASG
jgi:hypothetical protein